MRHYLLLLLSICIFRGIYAQPGKKPAPKEKAPTQKEMQEMMKEAQKEIDNMDPETKRMMDSLGIKMPDFNKTAKDVSGVSDAQLKEAFDNENRIVPAKDTKRIAGIAATPAGAAGLSSLLLATHNKVASQLSVTAKTDAEELYQELVKQYKDRMGNIAAGIWMAGKLPFAMYIMGKACLDDPGNADNINNYAAMLSMTDAPQLAIPLLNYLNKNFPGNSTILNNLGQAWFGLGDISKAEKYLDSTIRIYATHPQANFTKSFIEEEKGNKTEAINLVRKSLQDGYSTEKEERLRKLGEKMSANDLRLPPKTAADPLNLGGFRPPVFPKSVDECITLQPVWETYRANLDAEITKLKAQEKEASLYAAQIQEQRTKKDIAMVQASLQAGKPQGQFTSAPLYIHAASLKLKNVTDDYNRKITDWSKKVITYTTGEGLDLKNKYQAEMDRLRKEDDEQTGEGKPNKDYCPRYKKTSDDFLKAYNKRKEDLFLEGLGITKTFLNEMCYYSMYTNFPETFEVVKLQAKENWLGTLKAGAPCDFELITQFDCIQPEQKEGNGKLAEFDDVACQYHSEMNLLVFKMKSDCSRMTTELDAKFIKVKLKQDMDKETFSDQFMNCTVQVKASVGIGDKVKMGPLEAGLKAEAGAEVAFDRTGVTDVSLIAGVKAGVGIKNDDGKVKLGGAGAEGRISLISGKGSVKGTGMLSMIK